MAKILVIEDAEPLRNDVIEMLTFEGHDVRGAENGRVGIDTAKDYQPDLIICDIMMPEVDGYIVLDTLRNDYRTVSIPFIFLTAKTDRVDVRDGMGRGAEDYLTKPFVATDLLRSIDIQLEKRIKIDTMVEERLKNLSESIITALPHELRTPLNTIIGFSDMLIAEADRLTPDQTIEWAQHVNLAAQRLYRLVENYLLYVRAEIAMHDPSERRSLEEKYVDHPDTLLEFHAMHKAQQEGRQDDVKLDCQADVQVHISDHDLGKITEELVSNALKFSASGTPVTIKTQADGDDYVIVVEDEGRGMTAEQIQSIGAYMQFERWFYEQQGSGMGLTIVRRLIELYNGEITLESEVGEWTRVTVRLRRQPVKEEKI